MNYKELLYSPMIPLQVIPLIEKAVHTSIPIFIQGEHGLEKELIAKIIHYTGDRKDYRFYKIDCKTQTEDSFHNQLMRIFNENDFGAYPVTLYLKEIGILGEFNQSRLLDLVEDGFIQNGAGKKIFQHLRIIVSASDDVKEKVVQRKFSEDLYHRLNLLTITIPSLRKRTNDLPAIAQYMLKEHSKKMKINPVTISNNAITALKNYWWPGNLKELEQVILRSALFANSDILSEKDLIFENENEKIPYESKSNHQPYEQNGHNLSLFLVELVHRIKNPLVSIKTFTQLLREKYDDSEFREQFHQIVTEDIGKIDALLNSLLGYININTPMEKKNTVHDVIEDVLKKNMTLYDHKKIKIYRKYEIGLPETAVHDEQLKYIFNGLLQYSVNSLPSNGTIAFITKSTDLERQQFTEESYEKKSSKYVEVTIIFTGYRKPNEQFENVLGISSSPGEEVTELELRLIKEIIRKNHGWIKIEVNEKKLRTIISLTFPAERRKMIYYQSIDV